MSSSSASDQLSFDGSNWEDLSRLVTQAKMVRLVDTDIDTDAAQGAWLAQRLRGPAIDWFGAQYAVTPGMLNNFDAWVEDLRNQFGVSDDGLRARRRGQLEGLHWQADLPVFFAEFDRLTALLGVAGNAPRIAMLRGKLPEKVRTLLAEQALDFTDYGTMRERLLTMWALDPKKNTSMHSSSSKKKDKPRCGKCGKKGHTASDCRDAKN